MLPIPIEIVVGPIELKMEVKSSLTVLVALISLSPVVPVAIPSPVSLGLPLVDFTNMFLALPSDRMVPDRDELKPEAGSDRPPEVKVKLLPTFPVAFDTKSNTTAARDDDVIRQ